MELIFTKDQAKKDRQRFGGNTLAVFIKNRFRCVGCNMTMQEHLDKYGKRLTVHHINGLGRNCVEPDNRLENLETVCLRCHGIRDCQNEKWLNSNACKGT
jgi:predicted HNH restriction endonuclease